MTGHQVVAIGDVTGAGGESVYVGFDVTPDERTAIVSVLADDIDLSKVREGDTIGEAYKLDNGDVAVHIPDPAFYEYRYD